MSAESGRWQVKNGRYMLNPNYAEPWYGRHLEEAFVLGPLLAAAGLAFGPALAAATSLRVPQVAAKGKLGIADNKYVGVKSGLFGNPAFGASKMGRWKLATSGGWGRGEGSASFRVARGNEKRYPLTVPIPRGGFR